MPENAVDYVIDTTVVMQHLIQDVNTSHVDALFNLLGQSVTLYLPEFCLLECVNVLWKRVRFQNMPNETAIGLLNNLLALPIQIVPAAPFFQRALQIGLKNQLAIYDSIYIALAEQRNIPLITEDARQLEAALVEGVSVKPLTDFGPH